MVTDTDESCDDGNTDSGDGCSASCQLEYVCANKPSCGDNNIDIGEMCDDGNREHGDGCNGNCMEEFCGDGIVSPAIGETCEPAIYSGAGSCVGCVLV
jgi:cysteine-rich repeat protein